MKGLLYSTLGSVVLEIGTGEAVSVISNLGQETQAPGSLISSVRNWPFFRVATCGGHKTALMCAHETCARPNSNYIRCISFHTCALHCGHCTCTSCGLALRTCGELCGDISVLVCVVAAYLGRTSSYENNDHGVDQRKQQRHLFKFSRAPHGAQSV